MKELSLNILDIAQNSVKAKATLIKIEITEDSNELCFTVTDNGCGMTEEFLRNVTDPFTTTRTTRKVGLGLPLLKMQAEQTGGALEIASRHESLGEGHGTRVKAIFKKNSIDITPLGDIISTVCALVQGAGDIDYEFVHSNVKGSVYLSTAEMRQMLGEEIPLSEPEIIMWVRSYLEEGYAQIQ